jgi:leader peptidase (prepilin peptidase) / N-methyltransferase
VSLVELRFLLEPWALALLGLCIGSFLNVVVHRMPLMMERQWWGDLGAMLADTTAWKRVFGAADAPRGLPEVAAGVESAVAALPPLSLSRPRSRCPACGHAIAWHENIPVLGWLRLRGRCSACGTTIGWRYPAVEIAVGLLFLAIGLRFGATPVALLWCAMVAVLVAAALIDWDTTLLPDDLTLPLLWAGLVAAWAGWTIDLRAAVIGAVAGYGALWLVTTVFKIVTGKQGMGHGDFKLLAALGAWLGASMLLPIVLLSSLIGAVVGLAMKARGSLREGRYVPFGPFLVGAGLVVILASPDRVQGWMGFAF